MKRNIIEISAVYLESGEVLNVKIEDEIITAVGLVHMIGTIGYEIVFGINNRLTEFILINNFSLAVSEHRKGGRNCANKYESKNRTSCKVVVHYRDNS